MIYDLDFDNLNSSKVIELIAEVLILRDATTEQSEEEHIAEIISQLNNTYSDPTKVKTKLSDLKLPPEYIDKQHIELLLGLNDLLQSEFLRKQGMERQQLKLSESHIESAQKIIEQRIEQRIEPLLRDLGHINKVGPQNLTPEALLLLGAAEDGVKTRLKDLHEYLPELKPSAIYLLSGQRPLWALHEESTATLLGTKIHIPAQDVEKKFIEKLIEIYNQSDKPPTKSQDEELQELISEERREFRKQIKTALQELISEERQEFRKQIKTALQELTIEETKQFREQTMEVFSEQLKECNQNWPTEFDMMQYIIDQDELKKYNIKIIPIDTPLKEDMQRPNTTDTLESFHKYYMKHNQGDDAPTILAISSQPHIPYQHAAIESVLSGHSIEVIGPGVIGPISINTMLTALDAVARTLFVSLPAIAKQLPQKKELSQSEGLSTFLTQSSVKEVTPMACSMGSYSQHPFL